MHTAVNVITLAVRDIDRSVRFYAEGLGCEVVRQSEDGAVLKLGGPGGPQLELRPWDALAGDAGVDAAGHGFRGYSLGFRASSAAEVDAAAAESTKAGARLVSGPEERAGHTYSAVFVALDEAAWSAASAG